MLKKTEKYFFLISFVVLAITGLCYLYFRDLAPKSSDPFSVVSSPWQSWMIKLHVIVAPLFVFMVGWVVAQHAWPRYRQRRKRGKKSGISNMLLLVIAVATGYLLQIFTDDICLRWTSWIHIGVSALCLLVLLIHQKITEKNNA